MSTAQVCRDFVNGYCRFGNSCRYYHPPSNGNFGSRIVSSLNTNPPGQRPTGLKYQFNEDVIRTELLAERPTWFISSFGASKFEPNLFFGYDTSQEEMRWKSLQAIKSGQPQEYIKEEGRLREEAETTIKSALSSLSATNNLAERLHDARYPTGTVVGGPRPDTFSEAAVLAGTSLTSPAKLSSSTPAVGSAFGQTAFGHPAGGVGGGTFRQSAFGAKSTFGGGGSAGVTSAFGGGSTTGGTFGQSSFGAKPAGQLAFGSSSFGQSSTPASGSAFGSSAFAAKSSAFGSSSFGSNSGTSAAPSSFASQPPVAFGQSSTPGTSPTSAFGAATKSSAFGSSSTPSTFGSTSMSNPAPGSAFGQSAFGMSGFSKPSTSGSTTSAFGPSSTLGTSAFGASSATPATGSAFGQSAFGHSAKPAGSTSVFGSAPSGSSGGFGAFSKPAQTSAGGGFGGFSSTSSSANAAAPASDTTPAPSQPSFTGFGKPAAVPVTTTGAFGSGSAFGTNSAFGQSSKPTTAFNTSTFGNTVSTPAFGGNSAFDASPVAAAFAPHSTSASPVIPAPPPGWGSGTGNNSLSSLPSKPGVSAFSRDTEKTGDMTPSTSGMPNQFPPGTKIPQGWSYEDPWSWTFPSLQGNEAGKMEDRLAEIFRSDSFSLGAIPSIPPPIEMRA